MIELALILLALAVAGVGYMLQQQLRRRVDADMAKIAIERERLAFEKEKSALPERRAPMPEDLRQLALSEAGGLWAQVDTLRALEERYAELGDWNKVRASFDANAQNATPWSGP